MNARGHLSSETLDLLSLSALAEQETRQAREHLDNCPRCRSAWDELEESRARFTQYVFPRTLPKVEAAARPAPLWERVKQKWTLALPFAGLVTVTVLAVIFVNPQLEGAEQPYYGTKGGAQLDVVALRGDRQLPVGNDTTLSAGDRIRFLVDSGGAHYVLLVSKDGEGNVTVYYPYDGAESAELPGAGGLEELPGSIELDAAVGRERLFAIFSDQPVRADAVRTALERGEDLQALPGVREVATREFMKEAR
ncbi:MAG: DUF4384 domain-containing protein [Myxococcaceae bacterium]|nr:DUF4384 domain-containing protein [Myxococcaceae bacterium]